MCLTLIDVIAKLEACKGECFTAEGMPNAITETDAEKEEEMLSNSMRLQLLQSATQISSDGAQAKQIITSDWPTLAQSAHALTDRVKSEYNGNQDNSQVEVSTPKQGTSRTQLAVEVTPVGQVDHQRKDQNEEQDDEADAEEGQDEQDEQLDHVETFGEATENPAAMRRSEHLKDRLEAQELMRRAAANARQRRLQKSHMGISANSSSLPLSDYFSVNEPTFRLIGQDPKLSPAARRNQIKRKNDAQHQTVQQLTDLKTFSKSANDANLAEDGSVQTTSVHNASLSKDNKSLSVVRRPLSPAARKHQERLRRAELLVQQSKNAKDEHETLPEELTAIDEELVSDSVSTLTPAPMDVKLSPAARRNQIKRQSAAQRQQVRDTNRAQVMTMSG